MVSVSKGRTGCRPPGWVDESKENNLVTLGTFQSLDYSCGLTPESGLDLDVFSRYTSVIGGIKLKI